VAARTVNPIVKEMLEKFPHLPTRSIARIILFNHGDLFNNDIERIRSVVRYQRGTNGEKSRENAGFIPKKTKIPNSWYIERTPYNLKPGYWLILSDIHVPFHMVKPIEAAISYAKDAGVTGLLINGDFQDNSAISRWAPTRKRDFDAELMVAVELVNFLSYEFRGKALVLKEGNHDYRLERLFQVKNPELMGIPLAAMDTALGLEAKGFDIVSQSQKVMAGELPIFHGHEVSIATAVNPARGLFLKLKSWGMCAHHHRTSEHSERNVQDTLLTTWSLGCMCDLKPDYAPYNNWNWGFAMVTVAKNGYFEVENKRILSNGKVV
jgi:hypothetical protein